MLNDETGKLFYIGGVVRDELLGREAFDVDIVYEGDAIEHCSSFGDVVRVNPDFGTVRVKIDGQEVDFASTRSEKYPKAGHLPVVEKIGCPLRDDVMRRDFTVNALAKSVKTGEFVDYVGGLDDLKAGVIRVLHDKSFIDDPTRIIRALKFSVRFGFSLEAHTRKLQEEYLAHINYDMCYKRVKKELIETFNLNSQEAYERFYNEGIYKLLTKEKVICPQVDFSRINMDKTPNLWLVFLAPLDLSRLELTRAEAKILEDFHYLKNFVPKSDFEIYKAFEKVAPETVWMYAAYVSSDIVRRFEEIKNIKLEINGEDLKSLGIVPSPKYVKIFDKVLKEKLSMPMLTKEDELKLVESLFL